MYSCISCSVPFPLLPSGYLLIMQEQQKKYLIDLVIAIYKNSKKRLTVTHQPLQIVLQRADHSNAHHNMSAMIELPSTAYASAASSIVLAT